jgi:hypothetical protein
MLNLRDRVQHGSATPQERELYQQVATMAAHRLYFGSEASGFSAAIVSAIARFAGLMHVSRCQFYVRARIVRQNSNLSFGDSQLLVSQRAEQHLGRFGGKSCLSVLRSFSVPEPTESRHTKQQGQSH